MTVTVSQVSEDFRDWHGLIGLLHAAFAYQEGRIDPPSSLHRLDALSIAEKAKEEQLFVAMEGDGVLGCVFAKSVGSTMYVGKLAVSPQRQAQGIGRALMKAVEVFARQTNHNVLELDARIELTENHQTFSALGFIKAGEHAHAGYDRNTFITMRKALP